MAEQHESAPYPELPEVVAWKVKDILEENNAGDFTLTRNHFIASPMDNYDVGFRELPYGQVVRIYDQGQHWLVVSYGLPYLEPITLTGGVTGPRNGMYAWEFWMLIWDDDDQTLDVYQCFTQWEKPAST